MDFVERYYEDDCNVIVRSDVFNQDHPLKRLISKRKKLDDDAVEKEEETTTNSSREESEKEVVDEPLFDPLLNPLVGKNHNAIMNPVVHNDFQEEEENIIDVNIQQFRKARSTHRKSWNAYCEKVMALSSSRFSSGSKTIVKVQLGFLKGTLESENNTQQHNKSVTLSKSKMRLEHLEAYSSGGKSKDDSNMGQQQQQQEKIVLTQKEYKERIDGLHRDLKVAWSRNERVSCLKIAIQCAKLLSDISLPSFYPSLWVYVTRILDTFGELVFDRIANLGDIQQKQEGQTGEEDKVSLKGNTWQVQDVPQGAKETARNWFFKIACIRDLVPRLYIEIALIPCYRFLTTDSDFGSILGRIIHVIRGIGDPLISIFCRTYLGHVEACLWEDFSLPYSVIEKRKIHLFDSFSDYLFIQNEFKQRRRAGLWTETGLTHLEYEQIQEPAVEGVLKILGKEGSWDQFQKLMDIYHKQSKFGSIMIFGGILSCFPPRIYVHKLLDLVDEIINTQSNTLQTKMKLFTILATRLHQDNCPPPNEFKMEFLNRVWNTIEHEFQRKDNLVIYAGCCSAFIELTLKYYNNGNETSILLRHLVEKLDVGFVEYDSSNLSIAPHLEQICHVMCESANGDLNEIITNEHLLKLLDMFKSERKTKLCKNLLVNFLRYTDEISDPIVIHAGFAIARDLHDSIDSLTFEDEKRQVADVISTFIKKINLGTDYERHFNLLVDFRGSFPNLDIVKYHLVVIVIRLGMNTLKIVRRKHNSRTEEFVKSCLAYCHITIPSIDSVFTRITLFQLCGQVALANGFLSQTDTFYKHCIWALSEVPPKGTLHTIDLMRVGRRNVATEEQQKSTEKRFVEILKSIVSSLLPVPCYPKPFSLCEELFDMIEDYEHWNPNLFGKIKVKISLLRLLAAYGQKKFIIQVAGVEANDILYGQSPEYLEDLSNLTSRVLESIMTDLSDMNEFRKTTESLEKDDGLRKQSSLVILELVNTIISMFRIDQQNIFKLVKKLMELVNNDQQQPPIIKSVKTFYENTKKLVERYSKQSKKIAASESLADQRAAYLALLKKFH